MLKVEGLTIRAGARRLADGMAFDLAEGSVTCLIGPSGCGKTSVLKWLTGILPRPLEATGSISLDGRSVTPPHRDIGYQPQNDALFPWLTIADNAALGLEMAGLARRSARDRAAALFEPFGLSGCEDLHPDQLSGGMRQRAAFLRTIVRDGRFVLLDEPFSALDAVTRLRMQDWLCARLAETRRGVLLVTHDLHEATRIGDRILVMSARSGVIAADIAVPMAREDRSERALADIQANLKTLLLEKET